jgi:hypothetical protein
LVRGTLGAGSLTAAARELARYKLDLVGVQKVRWDKEGRVSAGDYNFSAEKETKIINLEQKVYQIHQRIISAVKRIEFVSDRMSYIAVRGRWCNAVVLNVHPPSEDKSDDSKRPFCKELEQVFDHFPSAGGMWGE